MKIRNLQSYLPLLNHYKRISSYEIHNPHAMSMTRESNLLIPRVSDTNRTKFIRRLVSICSRPYGSLKGYETGCEVNLEDVYFQIRDFIAP